MTRLVEVLVGMSALCGIATFVIARGAWKKLKRTLGRPIEPLEEEGPDGLIRREPFERSDVERRTE